MHPPRDRTIRWGDSAALTFTVTTPGTQTIDLIRAELDYPAVCRLSLHAEVVSASPTGILGTSIVTYETGIGSASVRVRREYAALPQVPTATQSQGTPLDVVWELPLQRIYAQVTASAAPDVQVRYTLQVAPIFALGGRRS